MRIDREPLAATVAATAPGFEWPRSKLQQTVSWSSKDSKLVSLQDFIASRLPDTASRLGLPPYQGGEPVKRIDELNEDELKQVVVTRLQEDTNDFTLQRGGESYTKEALAYHVRNGTGVGCWWVSVSSRSISLTEQLIELGKLKRVYDGDPPPLELPDFPF